MALHCRMALRCRHLLSRGNFAPAMRDGASSRIEQGLGPLATSSLTCTPALQQTMADFDNDDEGFFALSTLIFGKNRDYHRWIDPQTFTRAVAQGLQLKQIWRFGQDFLQLAHLMHWFHDRVRAPDFEPWARASMHFHAVGPCVLFCSLCHFASSQATSIRGGKTFCQRNSATLLWITLPLSLWRQVAGKLRRTGILTLTASETQWMGSFFMSPRSAMLFHTLNHGYSRHWTFNPPDQGELHYCGVQAIKARLDYFAREDLEQVPLGLLLPD